MTDEDETRTSAEARAAADARVAVYEARVAAFDGAIWLWFLQLGAAAVACFVVLSHQWETPHCGLRCDYELLTDAGDAIVLVSWATLLVSALTLILLRAIRPRGSRRRRWDWWIPCAGIAITLIAGVVTYRLTDIALLFG